ncbi:MAG: hypothetical protein CMF41_02735 [Legionellales bacterium]|nr:hypothetical protein [Legionellales bacterium]
MAEISILIVGAGQIGSRHLQGLAKLEIDTRIYVVDPDENALSIAKARYDEAQMHSNKQALFFYKSLDLVKDTIDVAIIATNAKVRKKIIQTVVACIKVRYFILEKIAFQSKADFVEIIQLLGDLGIQAWVNCPRRLYSIYRYIKSCIDRTLPIYMSITGGNWALSSNSIHWLDLFNFFLENAKISHSFSNLDKTVYPSKREGYVDLYGELMFESDANRLHMCSARETSCPPLIHIENGHQRFLIDEFNGQCTSYNADHQWQPRIQSFQVPFQSDLTQKVVYDILKTEQCDLALLDISILAHQPLFDALANHNCENIMLSIT